MMFVKCHHWMHLHWFNNKTYTQRDSCNHWIIILNLSVQPINYEMHLQHIDFWTECCIYKPLCDLTIPSLYNLYITSTNFCLIIKWYFWWMQIVVVVVWNSCDHSSSPLIPRLSWELQSSQLLQHRHHHHHSHLWTLDQLWNMRIQLSFQIKHEF